MSSETPLADLVLARLDAEGAPDATANAVRAALIGDDELLATLAGQMVSLARSPAEEGATLRHVYLSSVTVAGFRGVGPARTLPIRPRAGLTVVVGRNGSGKSSFAEAAEVALTSQSARWADRASVWRAGWRNLHVQGPSTISVELRVDGQTDPVRVERSWSDQTELTAAALSITGHNGLTLVDPLALYRPFLTPVELGMLVSGAPSKLFDAINAILGLDLLTEADKRLLAAVGQTDVYLRSVRAGLDLIRTSMAAIDDDRATRAGAVLATKQPDLDLLDQILAEPYEDGSDGAAMVCRQVTAMAPAPLSQVTQLAEDVRAAVADAGRHDGARTRALVRTAEMLRLALDQHEAAGDTECPVCGVGRLDGSWRVGASTSLDELRISTVATQRASTRLAELSRQARALVDDLLVPDLDVDGVRLEPVRVAVADLRTATSMVDSLADQLLAAYPAVIAAVNEAQSDAEQWLRQRDADWRPAAAGLTAWVATARQVPEYERRKTNAKGARAWLANAAERIRDERLAPFAAHSQRIWQHLRQESNVELGTMTLTGTNTKRRIAFPVSVDDADNGTALGVMSQGELHALALALFLPRSCAEESPFRFVFIDDPVQSMDPSKVDGLARVLGELADDRQVVVFTHDPRLPNALRRLDVDADVIEVVRADRSVITLRPALDPVTRYLDDARAVALSKHIGAEVRAPVVAEMCRSALEAACHNRVWRVRVARGVPHVEIEEAIEKAGKKLTTSMALALFDDGERGGDVLGQVRRTGGARAVEAYQACRKGVHGAQLDDLPRLVNDISTIAGTLA